MTSRILRMNLALLMIMNGDLQKKKKKKKKKNYFLSQKKIKKKKIKKKKKKLEIQIKKSPKHTIF